MGKLIVTIVAAIASLATAYFSYTVANERKQLRDVQVPNLTRDLESTRKTLADTKGELDSTKKTLADTQSQLDSKTAELTTTKGELDTTKTQLTQAQSELNDTKGKLSTTENELAELKSAIGDKPIQEIKAEYQRAVAAERTLTEEKKALEDRLATLKSDLDRRAAQDEADRTGAISAGIEGKIVAVNAQWGFVVLNVGRQQGIAENAIMTVVRGNQPVAQLKIATVDQNTAVADVVRTDREQRIYLGDQVISN